jgi:hypothetical protein
MAFQYNPRVVTKVEVTGKPVTGGTSFDMAKISAGERAQYCLNHPVMAQRFCTFALTVESKPGKPTMVWFHIGFNVKNEDISLAKLFWAIYARRGQDILKTSDFQAFKAGFDGDWLEMFEKPNHWGGALPIHGSLAVGVRRSQPNLVPSTVAINFFIINCDGKKNEVIPSGASMEFIQGQSVEFPKFDLLPKAMKEDPSPCRVWAVMNDHTPNFRSLFGLYLGPKPPSYFVAKSQSPTRPNWPLIGGVIVIALMCVVALITLYVRNRSSWTEVHPGTELMNKLT